MSVTARTVPRIAEIDPATWDALAGDENPFVSFAFLSALEDAGCVGGRTGWQPRHLVLEQDGRVIGVMPLYLKLHSMGEYIFDQGWAQAWERAGGAYYPKLLCAVPFTPATGPRLLAATVENRALLAQAAAQVAREMDVSSLHVNFTTQADRTVLADSGYLIRTGEQFHWQNHGYTDFDAYLAALNARKRKAVRRERRDALASGIDIEVVTGAALQPEHWDAFHAFYMDTGGRKWGQPYLNRQFFGLLGERLADRVVLVMAKRSGHWIAGALNLRGRDTLFGRNWGCLEHHPCLHFEVCYYQAIEYAIIHGLDRVEAGAQGEHKLARGYLPVATHSAHWIADLGFRRAVADFLLREGDHVAAEIALLEAHSPFRKMTLDQTITDQD